MSQKTRKRARNVKVENPLSFPEYETK